jgi:hypothetical protein
VPWIAGLSIFAIVLSLAIVGLLIQVSDWTVRELPPGIVVWAEQQY